jgi:hypothetical protein
MMKIQRLLLQGVVVGTVSIGAAARLEGQSNRQNPVQTPTQSPTSISPIDRAGPANSPFGRNDQDAISLSPVMEEQQTRSRNSERQKRLQGDTDKLLALAQSLKDELDKPQDKSDKSPAALDVARKAEEIEKLAKSVKDHMKG